VDHLVVLDMDLSVLEYLIWSYFLSQPDSAGSLRRQIGQMLIKHHQSIDRNNHALQPVSPASYGSSLEV